MTPLLDTHVHFWDRGVAGLKWPWLEEGFKSAQHTWTEASDRRPVTLQHAHRFTSTEFRAEVAGLGVAGMVHANAASAMADAADETRWLAAMRETDGWPLAMIGSCQLVSPDGPDLLRRHREASESCRAVRDMKARGGLDLDAAAASLDVASALGYSVELRTEPENFRMISALADRWPAITFVLSHASLPTVRTPDSLTAWTSAAKSIADRPNLMCKISALCGGSDPNWTIDSIRPWAEACYDVFGPDRAMLGTNWPVDRLFGSYAEVVGAYRTLFGALSASEQARLFYGNAATLYGIAIEDLDLTG